jgi:hypothetical protein
MDEVENGSNTGGKDLFFAVCVFLCVWVHELTWAALDKPKAIGDFTRGSKQDWKK